MSQTTVMALLPDKDMHLLLSLGTVLIKDSNLEIYNVTNVETIYLKGKNKINGEVKMQSLVVIYNGISHSLTPQTTL